MFQQVVQVLVFILVVIVILSIYGLGKLLILADMNLPTQVLPPNSAFWTNDTNVSGNPPLNTRTPYYKFSDGLYINADGSLCAVIMKADDNNLYGIICKYSTVSGGSQIAPMVPTTAPAGSWSGYGQIPCRGLNVVAYPGFETPPACLASASKFLFT